MPGLLHETIVELFRSRPVLAAELLRDVLAYDVPSFVEARIGEGDLTTLAPTSFLTDLVVLLSRGEAVLGIIVEVQLQIDNDKPMSWLVYLANLQAKIRAPVVLVVVATDDRVSAWCSRTISYAHPGLALRPLVLGPKNVPLVTDEAIAAEMPELAVLSALVHSQGEHAFSVGKAAVSAALQLDAQRAQIYVDLILSKSVARLDLEKTIMLPTDYEFQSDFMKKLAAKGHEKGLEQGRAQGLEQGRAEALLVVLRARGFAISDETAARIRACTDVTTLDDWIARAAVVGDVNDIFGA